MQMQLNISCFIIVSAQIIYILEIFTIKYWLL